MSQEGKTSAWVYVGIGCGSVLILIVLAVGVLLFAGYRWVRNVEETFKDPVARTERVHEILGTEELPEGYHAMLGFRVPFLADIAVLSDRAPDASGMIEEFESRGFIYVRLLRTLEKQRRETREFLEGTRGSSDILDQSNIHIDREEVVRRGQMTLESGADVLYAVYRGRVFVKGHPAKGLAAITMVECPQDRKLRIGIWFGPDPESEDLTGSTADESAIRAFLSNFALCDA